MGGTVVVRDMQWTACGREGACTQSLIRSNSLMAVTWRKRSQNGLKWRKIKIWGAFWGNWEAKLNFLPSKTKKLKILEKFGFFWKISNYNCQSRRQIITARGVYCREILNTFFLSRILQKNSKISKKFQNFPRVSKNFRIFPKFLLARGIYHKT